MTRRTEAGVALRRDRQVEGRMAAAAEHRAGKVHGLLRGREAARLQRADGKAEEQLDDGWRALPRKRPTIS